VLAVAPVPALADDDPTITQAPVISGTAQVGQTLTATSGTWTGTEPVAATYQWLSCSASSPNNCSAISGATGLSYTAVSGDEGSVLRIALTVTNAFGDDSVRSKATSPVAAPPAPDPVITQAPEIFGVAQVGQSLTSTSGTWGGTEPITATYQWLRCSALTPTDCNAISGATGLSYLAVPEDEGYLLRVALTVTNAFGGAGVQSAATSPVAAAPAPNPDPSPQPPPLPDPGPAPAPDPGPAPAPAPGALAATTTGRAPTATVLTTSLQPLLLDPFPVVRFRGYVTSSGARITLLTVRTRRGTHITITCSGVTCPPGAERWAAPEGVTRLRRFERFLTAGVRITITVTKKGWIGKQTEIVIRRDRPPLRRDRCLYPGSALPAACPLS
jgi:hypothetical protein